MAELEKRLIERMRQISHSSFYGMCGKELIKKIKRRRNELNRVL